MAKAVQKPAILIVDDERSFAESLQLAIEDEFLVFKAYSLKSAREILRCVVPAVVLLDVRLPDGYGLDLLLEMKMAEVPSVVVVMTAYSTVETFIGATSKGAVDYLIKPLNIAKLKEVLRTRLRDTAASSG